MSSNLCANENCVTKKILLEKIQKNDQRDIDHYTKSQQASVFCNECNCEMCYLCYTIKHPVYETKTHRIISLERHIEENHTNITKTLRDFVRLEQINQEKIKEEKEKENTLLEKGVEIAEQFKDIKTCIATPLEQQSLNLLRQNVQIKECFHQSCRYAYDEQGNRIDSACWNMHQQMSALLCKRRSVSDKKSNLEYEVTNQAFYILKWACEYGFVDILDELISRFKQKSFFVYICNLYDILQKTALHYALDYTNVEIVSRLLPFMSKKGIEIQQANHSKKTALEITEHYSVHSKNETEREKMRQITDMIKVRLEEL